jgi:hypothetical protein
LPHRSQKILAIRSVMPTTSMWCSQNSSHAGQERTPGHETRIAARQRASEKAAHRSINPEQARK